MIPVHQILKISEPANSSDVAKINFLSDLTRKKIVCCVCHQRHLAVARHGTNKTTLLKILKRHLKGIKCQK